MPACRSLSSQTVGASRRDERELDARDSYQVILQDRAIQFYCYASDVCIIVSVLWRWSLINR
jgi:hypothetical protein